MPEVCQCTCHSKVVDDNYSGRAARVVDATTKAAHKKELVQELAVFQHIRTVRSRCLLGVLSNEE